MKRYKIVRIDEADYGCEGRPDGEEAWTASGWKMRMANDRL